MLALGNVAFAVVVILSVVHFLLPRRPGLRLTRGRLWLSPPLRERLPGVSAVGLGFLGVSFLAVLLVAANFLFAAAMTAAALGVLALWGWRRWEADAVVFDRRADAIRQGATRVAPVTRTAGVQVTGADSPALVLFLHEVDGTTRVWPVPWVERAQAPELGKTIASYLRVPLTTRLG